MKLVLFLLALICSSAALSAQSTSQPAKEQPALVKHITTEEFKQYVFDYSQNPDTFKSKNTKPVLIDFYATWCGPCRALSPVVEQLAGEYADKITVYKVNVDKEPELSQVFGIRSIPNLLFVPVNGKPSQIAGALPYETFKQVIEVFLLGKPAPKEWGLQQAK